MQVFDVADVCPPAEFAYTSTISITLHRSLNPSWKSAVEHCSCEAEMLQLTNILRKDYNPTWLRFFANEINVDPHSFLAAENNHCRNLAQATIAYQDQRDADKSAEQAVDEAQALYNEKECALSPCEPDAYDEAQAQLRDALERMKTVEDEMRSELNSEGVRQQFNGHPHNLHLLLAARGDEQDDDSDDAVHKALDSVLPLDLTRTRVTVELDKATQSKIRKLATVDKLPFPLRKLQARAARARAYREACNWFTFWYLVRRPSAQWAVVLDADDERWLVLVEDGKPRRVNFEFNGTRFLSTQLKTLVWPDENPMSPTCQHLWVDFDGGRRPLQGMSEAEFVLKLQDFRSGSQAAWASYRMHCSECGQNFYEKRLGAPRCCRLCCAPSNKVRAHAERTVFQKDEHGSVRMTVRMDWGFSPQPEGVYNPAWRHGSPEDALSSAVDENGNTVELERALPCLPISHKRKRSRYS